MKIAELAKKLNLPPTELREKIKKLGFDIGKKPRTIKDSTAQEIIDQLSAEIEILKATQEKKLKNDKIEKPKKDEKVSEEIIEIPSVITVKNFAVLLQMPVTTVITELMKNGIFATINENIDFETAAILADDFNKKVTRAKEVLEIPKTKQNIKNLKPRSPVVVIMGHVDHGKTTLLDYIRQTSVATSESGGITQHIGAYQTKVEIPKKDGSARKVTPGGGKEKRLVTFLDTPGHEAFTAMRAHGAKITDLAVLVVAAEEGVKPQTLEAINHAKAAGVPIIVAINKIDKPAADINKTKRELSEAGLATEDWGGTTTVVPISAKTGQGVDELLELIVLTADLLELKADPEGSAEGVVIESHLDPGLGPVATILVQKGTLKVGQVVVVGQACGKIRVMKNFLGEKIKQAGPSFPVQVIGLSKAPNFGQNLEICETEKKAKEKAEKNAASAEVKSITISDQAMGEISQSIREGALKELHIVLKADVVGSIEAIKNSIEALSNEEVSVKIIHQGIGPVSESDINLAAATRGLVIAFRVPITATAQQLATQEKVKITHYDIIYELLDDVQTALSGLLEPEIIEVEVGKAKVLKVFTHGKKSQILGCKVTSGKLENNLEVRAIRDKVEIGLGKIDSLQQNKKSVPEVLENFECGLGLKGEFSSEVIEGDTLIAFKKEEKVRKLASKNAKNNEKKG